MCAILNACCFYSSVVYPICILAYSVYRLKSKNGRGMGNSQLTDYEKKKHVNVSIAYAYWGGDFFCKQFKILP
jgi:hypothetical protein